MAPLGDNLTCGGCGEDLPHASADIFVHQEITVLVRLCEKCWKVVERALARLKSMPREKKS